MKKLHFLLLSSLILLSYELIAQERNTPSKLAFSQKTEKITNILYWKKDRYGDWSNTNPIQWMRLTSVEHNGSKYYVLLYDYYLLDLLYSKGEMHWIREMHTYFFILEEYSYKLLKEKINSKSDSILAIPSYRAQSEYNSSLYKTKIDNKWHEGYPSPTEENLLKEIKLKIEGKEESWVLTRCILVNYQNLKGAEVVRFRLFTMCELDKDFESGYYEVPFDDFIKLLYLQ